MAHLDAGATIVGVERNGTLVGARCGSMPVPLPLPPEAMPLTQAAADMSARWHPEFLHLLKPGPGVVIRPWPPGDAVTAAEVDYDHALAALDALIAEHRAFGAELAAKGQRWDAVLAEAPAPAVNRRGM
jgi:hypothetical protein